MYNRARPPYALTLLMGSLLAGALVTGCADPSVVVLSPDGVERIDELVYPRRDFDGPSASYFALSFFEGHQIALGGDQVFFDEQVIALPPEEDDWYGVQSVAVGQGAAWALRPHRSQQLAKVLRFGLDEEGQEGWIEQAVVGCDWCGLVPRYGQEPVVHLRYSGAVIALDGSLVGEALVSESTVLVGGDTVFETYGMNQTYTVLGPDCEAHLAGELSNVISTPQGLETLSVGGNFLHHERVLPDCSVERIEDIYHPERGFDPVQSVHHGERSWAYWYGGWTR